MTLSPKTRSLLKNFGLTILTVLLVAGGSFFQERVLQVNATVQVLLVSRTAIAFGDVFPGQNTAQTYSVQLDTSANSATYVTTLDPLPGLQNLCPFLTLHSIDTPAEPDTLSNASLKRPGDIVDNWQVQLTVPGIQGELSQDHNGGIIVQGGDFGCKITITTTGDPGKIIICKQSLGATGSFNFSGDLGNFAIQTSASAPASQTNPCGSPPPCPSGSNQTSGSNSPIIDTTKCITVTTINTSNNSSITNSITSGSSSGGVVVSSGSGSVNGTTVTTGNATTNTSVSTSVNGISSTVNLVGNNTDTGSQVFDNLQSGSYTVMESSSTNWTLTSLVCQDPTNNSTTSGNAAEIQLDSGETVICTFINSLKKGSIIIQKKTVGGNGSFIFSGSLGAFSITTSSNLGSKTFANLSSGVYTVTEPADQPGWSLTALSCSDPTLDSQINNRNAVIHLAAGETVTCTFTNTKKK